MIERRFPDKPLCIDLYCGLGGWTEAFIAEGYECIGFDIEAHEYWVPDAPEKDASKNNGGSWFNIGSPGQKVTNQNPVHELNRAQSVPHTKLLKYPGELRIRDVRSIHGSELKDAACIVGSSPCQEFSYRAMPWKRAKALPPPYLGIELFNAQFRIQREAIEAAGHYIPMVVENVRGAQKWVGRSRWNYGSFHLWGDVPALMPFTFKAQKIVGYSDPRRNGGKGAHLTSQAENDSRKVAMNFHEHEKTGKPGRSFQSVAVEQMGIKEGGDWWNKECRKTGMAQYGSKSSARKRASAMIAKIPLPLSTHIARVFKPVQP